MRRYLETGDVARAEGVVPATIHAHVRAGLLRVSAITVRGSRLFTEEDVEEYRRQRAARFVAAGRQLHKPPGVSPSIQDGDQ